MTIPLYVLISFLHLYIAVLSYSFIESKEAYGLKNNYEVEITLDGSDKLSIEEGMREALEILMVRICLLYTSPSPRDRG